MERTEFIINNFYKNQLDNFSHTRNECNHDALFQALMRSTETPVNFSNQEALPLEEKIKALILGMAYQKMHGSEIKKPILAESVAYILCKNYGIDTSDFNFDNATAWFKNTDIEERKEDMAAIFRAANEIIINTDKMIEIDESKQHTVQSISHKKSFQDMAQIVQEKKQNAASAPTHTSRKQKNIKEITSQLEQGIKNLFDSDRYKTWLTTMSKFHSYSLNNTILIMNQCPNATHVAGYNAWKKQFNRQVKKGEKAIYILAPCPHKRTINNSESQDFTSAENKENQQEVKEVIYTTYRTVPVFDIFQTEGRELPTLGVDILSGDVNDYDVLLQALVQSTPVPVHFDKFNSKAYGFYSPVENSITIQKDLPQTQTLKTLIHEMAHQKLHGCGSENISSRNQKEVEAESIAYTICQHYGIDTSDYSFAYIAGWSEDKNMNDLKNSLKTIRNAASEMISAIDEKISELKKNNEISNKAKKSFAPRSNGEVNMVKEKQFQIPESLLVDLVKYHICGHTQFKEQIQDGLQTKLAAIDARREYQENLDRMRSEQPRPNPDNKKSFQDARKIVNERPLFGSSSKSYGGNNMVKEKQFQIPESLLVDLVKYHICGHTQFEKQIQDGLQAKLAAIDARREYQEKLDRMRSEQPRPNPDNKKSFQDARKIINERKQLSGPSSPPESHNSTYHRRYN